MTKAYLEHETPVVFRKDRECIVTAVFPTLPADYRGHLMTCYSHVGQHGGCAWDWYHRTRKARPEEYAALAAELQSIGYRLKVYAKITPGLRAQLREKHNASDN